MSDRDYEVVHAKGWIVLMIVAIAAFVWATIRMGQEIARERSLEDVAESRPVEAAGAASAPRRIVSKGCKCRHRLATAPEGLLGWAHRTWHDVSFEDWDRANVGDPWPLPAIAAPETKSCWDEARAMSERARLRNEQESAALDRQIAALEAALQPESRSAR